MSSAIQRITHGACVALASALVIALIPVGGANAASPAEKAASPQELDELDEIMVRGKRAAVAIADLEDDFYKRYNKLNKDSRYDMHCAYLNIDPDNPGSALQTRVCMPEFVSDALSVWARGRCDMRDFFTLDQNRDNALSPNEALADSELAHQYIALDANNDRRLTYVEWLDRAAEIPTQCYQPPEPELVLMEGSERWRKQMLQVTRSDPQLSEMAANLGGLYLELNSMQRRYNKLEKEIVSRTWDAKRVRGPRNL